MKISIKMFSKEGPIVLEVADDATLEDLKEALHESEGIPLRQQKAVFKKCTLEDNSQKLSEYSITDELSS